VDAEDRLDPPKTTVLDHRYGAARGLLFGVLEKEDDLSSHLVEVALQDLGQPQQHRRMPVVPARVHDFRDTGSVRNLLFVLDREGVHIGAERDRGSGMSTCYPSDHPVAAHPLGHTDAQLPQSLTHPPGSVVLPKR